MEKSVIVKVCEIPYSSHFWMLGKAILVWNTRYILYNSVYKRLGWSEMYWQRYKEIFLKMKKSTPQISMFWSSYSLGTIRCGFLDTKNIRFIFHPWGLFLLVHDQCKQHNFVHKWEYTHYFIVLTHEPYRWKMNLMFFVSRNPHLIVPRL